MPAWDASAGPAEAAVAAGGAALEATASGGLGARAGAGAEAAGLLAAAAVAPAGGVPAGSVHRSAGNRYTAMAAAISTAAAQTMGRMAALPKPGVSRPGRSRKGWFMALLGGSSGRSPVLGNRASTGSTSIFSDRHTVCASARVKVASGSSCQRSFSSASSLRGDTLMAAARAAMCRPCFSRAARKISPALGPRG